jgi:hypothetical protein
MSGLRALPLGRSRVLARALNRTTNNRCWKGKIVTMFCGIDWAENHVRHEALEVERGWETFAA